MPIQEEPPLLLDYNKNIFQKIFGCRKIKIETDNEIYIFRYIKKWGDTWKHIFYTDRGNYVATYINYPSGKRKFYATAKSLEELSRMVAKQAELSLLAQMILQDRKEKREIHL